MSADPVIRNCSYCLVHVPDLVRFGSKPRREIDHDTALALASGAELRGLVRGDMRAEGRDDANLDAQTLLEAMCSKASGALVLQWLLQREGMPAIGISAAAAWPRPSVRCVGAWARPAWT